jgi:hypothetical protein
MKKKISKIDFLAYIKSQDFVEIWQLRDKFNFLEKYVSQRLWRLKKQELVINMFHGQWELTEKGYRRLRYYGKKK